MIDDDPLVFGILNVKFYKSIFAVNGVRESKAVPGAIVAIQTFGDFPVGFHPHLHILVSDGCFHENEKDRGRR